jgi:hypothetical protein
LRGEFQAEDRSRAVEPQVAYRRKGGLIKIAREEAAGHRGTYKESARRRVKQEGLDANEIGLEVVLGEFRARGRNFQEERKCEGQEEAKADNAESLKVTMHGQNWK